MKLNKTPARHLEVNTEEEQKESRQGNYKTNEPPSIAPGVNLVWALKVKGLRHANNAHSCPLSSYKLGANQ